MDSKHRSFLTPLTGEKRNYRIAVFDLEAENMVETYALGFYDGNPEKKVIIFDDPEYHVHNFLMKFISKKYRGWYCFAHNGGRYDFLKLIEVLTKPEWNMYHISLIPQGSSIIGIDVRDDSQHVWHFRDSYAILPYSLRKLTQDFNVKHKKLELDFEKNHESQDWQKYLSYDCLGLYEVLQKYQSELNSLGGELGLTVASTALKTFRRTFLEHDIQTYHDYDDVIRQAYYGGRTEIFRMYAPEGKYFCYDINSMYPAVMKEGLYPVGTPTTLRYPDKSIFERAGICYVEGYSPEPERMNIPLLPVHYGKKLFFPSGYIQGWYDLALVKKALELGYNLEIKKAIVFNKEPLFKEYVDTFYKLKKKSVGAKRSIAKLLLNSLYGKFAERSDRTQFYINPKGKRARFLVPYDEDLNIYMEEKITEKSHVLPAISVHVTALAQLKLYNFFEKVTSRAGELFYCDTDSFFTDISLPTSNRLGDIKEEYSLKEAIFLLPKTYAVMKLNDDIYMKLKGFSPKSREKLSFRTFKSALFKKDLSVIQSEPITRVVTFRESVKRNLPLFSTVQQIKQIRSFYDKRIVNPDFSTTPLYLSRFDYSANDGIQQFPV